MTTKKVHILLFFIGILILSLACVFIYRWIKDYHELNAVRKTSPNYLKIVKLQPDEAMLETEVDMTPSKLYFHNSFPCLVICLNNSKYTRKDISNLKIEVESIDRTRELQRKSFKATEFKYIDENPKYLIKYTDKDSICFYPIGMIKLAPGLNRIKVTISGLSIANPDDIKVFLYFHETSNTMILLKPIKYLPMPGSKLFQQ